MGLPQRSIRHITLQAADTWRCTDWGQSERKGQIDYDGLFQYTLNKE